MRSVGALAIARLGSTRNPNIGASLLREKDVPRVEALDLICRPVRFHGVLCSRTAGREDELSFIAEFMSFEARILHKSSCLERLCRSKLIRRNS